MPAAISPTSTPITDCSASIEARARSYIDSNCGYCHRPNGVRANFDARLTTPLDQASIINGALVEGTGVPGEAALVPGNLMQSIMYHNANTVGDMNSMPPLAKSLVDQAGMAVFAAWIEALGNGTADKPSPVGCAGSGGQGGSVGQGGQAGNGGPSGGGPSGGGPSGGGPSGGQGGSGDMTSGGGSLAGSHVGPMGPEDGHCGCRVGQAGVKPKWLGWLLLSATLVARRRRRSRAPLAAQS
jgi:hypothetical protein